MILPNPDYYRTERYDQAEHWVYDPLSPQGVIYYSYVKEVIRHWPVGGRKVLDIGCGDGYIGHEIWQRENRSVVEIIGIDYSEQALHHAQRLAPELKLYCRDLTILNWAEGLPGPFDRVNFIETIEHIDPIHHPQILRTIRSVMLPGGLIMISTPSLRLPRDSKKHYKHFSLADITSQLEQAGFSVDKCYGLRGYYHPLTPWWIRHSARLSGIKQITVVEVMRRAMRCFYQIFLARAPLPLAGMYLIQATALPDS